MNSLIGVIVGAVIVVIGVFGFLNYQNSKVESKNSGSLYIGVTDATTDIANVSEVELTINKVEAFSEAKGWVTVSTESKTYELLKLNASGKTELYAKANIETGTYDKVRVTLGDVVIKTKANGNIKASLPSKYITIKSKVKVASDSDSPLFCGLHRSNCNLQPRAARADRRPPPRH